MGNVSISCCRSKSPRIGRQNDSSGRNGTSGNQLYGRKASTASKNQVEADLASLQQQQSNNILQHISEREPDDSETDPSSNAYNKPIFASRSSYTNSSIGNKSRGNSVSQMESSYSSNSHSNPRKLINTPLASSASGQDYGYNSAASTNLTQSDSSPLITDQTFETKFNENYAAPTTKRIENNQQPDLVKSSSCSTIFIDNSTISQPNLKQTIKCVSLAIYYHIKNRTSDEAVEIFDESLHPLRVPAHGNEEANNKEDDDSDEEDDCFASEQDEQQQQQQVFDQRCTAPPTQRTIYSFVKTLFKAAQLTSEYAITTLVYLERLMTYAEMDLTPKTWRRMFLGAILLSSKVWEDQAVWNVDYAQILEEISVEDINELERQFLELIQFNMNVPSSVYAKYYFHLRTLSLKHGLSEKYSLLNVGKAKTLEAMSRAQAMGGDWDVSPIHRKSPPALKRHTSLENLRFSGQARAVIM